MVGKLREIVDKLLNQFLGSCVIIGLVGPCLARVEDCAVNAFNRYWKFETEIRVFTEFSVVQAAVKRRIEQRPSCLDRHPANAGHRRLAAGPTGIDQPALNRALGDPLFQQIAINARMARHERRAETGRKSRFGLGYADLGARYARGVA